MTDKHADGETAAPIPVGSSERLMFETMARLHLQNDPLAPWGGEVDPHLIRDTPLWKRVNASPIPSRHATRNKRVWHVALLAVALAGMSVSVLAVRKRLDASTEFGTVERIIGTAALVRAEDASGGPRLAAGTHLKVGDEISTLSGGRVLLHVRGGALLQIDERSIARFASAGRVLLRDGDLEVDAPSKTAARALRILTRFGDVQEPAGQFEVRLDRNGLFVRPR